MTPELPNTRNDGMLLEIQPSQSHLSFSLGDSSFHAVEVWKRPAATDEVIIADKSVYGGSSRITFNHKIWARPQMDHVPLFGRGRTKSLVSGFRKQSKIGRPKMTSLSALS